MAKSKNTASDLDKRLKSIDELVESSEAIMNKFQDLPFLEKEHTQELKKHMTSLKKLKEGLASDIPAEVRKKIDQTIEKLRTMSQEKQKAATISEEEKEATLESVGEVMGTLNAKISDLRSQVEAARLQKKAKSHNKAEKLEKWIENIAYHTARLEKITKQFEAEGLEEQDSTLREIVSYFQDTYIEDAEYQQQKQSTVVDALYEIFEKQDKETISDSNQNDDNEIESFSTQEKIVIKEEPAPVNTVKEVQSHPQAQPQLQSQPPVQAQSQGQTQAQGQKSSQGQTQTQGQAQVQPPTQVLEGDKNSFMNKIRQRSFEHEIRKMPKIPQDIKGDYNFFEVFEASAKNIPQETDYFPNASTKERINTKNIYPKRKLVSEHIFERFDVDTLFFIFYFQKDTFEQFLAAKELKKRAWRFHKKYLTWFKRLEAPRVTNDDYEQGTYAFFDFEPGGWCQRRKSDFTFKYSYLEDDNA